MVKRKKRGIKSPRVNRIDVELGTGKYYPGGRPTPWVYRDEEGNFHWTAGNPAKPYLAPAVKNHTKTYRDIIENELKGMG